MECPSYMASAKKITRSGKCLITPFTRLGTIAMNTVVIIGLYVVILLDACLYNNEVLLDT